MNKFYISFHFSNFYHCYVFIYRKYNLRITFYDCAIQNMKKRKNEIFSMKKNKKQFICTNKQHTILLLSILCFFLFLIFHVILDYPRNLFVHHFIMKTYSLLLPSRFLFNFISDTFTNFV